MREYKVELLDEVKKAAEELRILNIMVLQNGRETARFDWDEEIRRNIYSATKSFTSAAVGLAVKEGLISLEENVCDAFSDDLPNNPCEELRALKVRDLLTMHVGQREALLMGGKRHALKERDWVKYVLAQPFACMPGKVFLYSNTGPYLAGILVQRRAGCNLADYMTPRLFGPLGIRRPTWETDPLGNSFGAGGLFLSVTELAKFAQLYLQGGSWNDRQILTREWVKESTAKQVEAPKGGEGYGYLFWRGPYNSFFCSGKYEQYGIVFPEKEAVIAVMAESHKENRVMDCVYRTVAAHL
jgi:CubicO group peptidase (beta-lactamase class C family)